MDISQIKSQPTADLLREFVTCDIRDTALGGAIVHELRDRGVEASDIYKKVLELIAIEAALQDDDDDELEYCGGLDPDSWCGKDD